MVKLLWSKSYFLKKRDFKLVLKLSKFETLRSSDGNSFHDLEAAALNERSPNDLSILPFGCCKIVWVVELKE